MKFIKNISQSSKVSAECELKIKMVDFVRFHETNDKSAMLLRIMNQFKQIK